MNLIIVGAGRIGTHLTKLALQDGHTITLIEANEKRAHAASQQYDAQVLQADIAQGGILDEAGADRDTRYSVGRVVLGGSVCFATCGSRTVYLERRHL